MTTTKHTAGPLEVVSGSVIIGPGRVVIDGSFQGRADNCDANAARVVACWYACLSIPGDPAAAIKQARETLTKLKRKHSTCEDSWYSCPASGDCIRDGHGGKCDCGADQDNAMIDEALRLLGG